VKRPAQPKKARAAAGAGAQSDAAPGARSGPDARGTADLHLDGEVTIYRALELKQTLVAALGATAALQINLRAVSEFDSAGVQLLLAAKRAAVSAGKTLSLVEHSPAVVAVFELLDLAPMFGDPLLVSAAPM
jgi:anti-anti-sigma factor